jgi:hypothetical protein
MKFPNHYILLLFVLFLLLIYVFYYFYNFNISLFIGKLNKKLYIYSSIICIFGFLITFYYILIKNDFIKKTTLYIFISICIMLISTILWIISSYYMVKILNIIFLLFLCLGNVVLLLLLFYIKENNYKILRYISILSITYLLFHHIFIDLYLWNLYKL